ncbi:FHA domain-containing protein [Arthrobacter antibioticus]|uniref:FHA domain-containing protein n=1 Tax=Arthrobacter sp. H35-MC1 TaxID=3046203 RepID=UPI0024BB02E1|nr:FHA domain-containing protein [Arthrobacter sp. H35-MC1]MDJ0317091.1 FHA domain-containing protein [Arthrobacter sp. H35-MC1]
MVSTQYSTGSWLGIVRSGSVIILEAQTDSATVNYLWEYLGQKPTIHGVLNEVTEKFGTGLTGMPDFAVVVQSDRLHAILRGDITLLAHTENGTEIVSGRDVTTWSERSLPLAESIELTMAEPDSYSTALVLPLGEGVVALQSLTIRLVDSKSADFVGPSGTVMGHSASSAETYDDAVAPLLPFAAHAHEQANDAQVFVADASSGDAGSHAETETRLWDSQAHGGEDAVAVHDSPSHEPAEEDGSDSEDESSAEADGAEAENAEAENSADGDYEADDRYEDAEALANFAKAAEAADAEWNAQLAPLDVAGDGPEPDLSRTIRPDMGEDHQLGEDQNLSEDQDLSGDHDPVEKTDEHEPSASAAGTLGGESAPSGQEQVDDGFTINYDYLFGATTMAQSVEAAAVRLDENGQPLQQENSEPALPPRPPKPPVAGNVAGAPAEDAAVDSEDAGGSGSGSGSEAEEAVDSVAGTFQSPEANPDSQMIDSVPWGNSGNQKQNQNQSAPVASGQDVSKANESYDPDHDGHTVMRGDVAAESAPPVAEPLESRPPTGPMVLARMCPHGHANPPSRSQCSACGAGINSEPREVGRPRLGTMHISTGELVELDHSLIIGRQPSVSRVMGGAMPRLVQVQSGNDDISRSHVEVRLDGWDVLLVDLKATNGTVLVREGAAPRRLSQGEEAILLNGDIAELGDGVSLLFDGLL